VKGKLGEGDPAFLSERRKRETDIAIGRGWLGIKKGESIRVKKRRRLEKTCLWIPRLFSSIFLVPSLEKKKVARALRRIRLSKG